MSQPVVRTVSVTSSILQVSEVTLESRSEGRFYQILGTSHRLRGLASTVSFFLSHSFFHFLDGFVWWVNCPWSKFVDQLNILDLFLTSHPSAYVVVLNFSLHIELL